jgi:hypothetical protein
MKESVKGHLNEVEYGKNPKVVKWSIGEESFHADCRTEI